jgi:hypothetical protein
MNLLSFNNYFHSLSITLIRNIQMSEELASFRLRNLIIRDSYKDRYLKERAQEKANERKNRAEILNRSAVRFAHSPFSTNFVALEEIREHSLKLDKQLHKPTKSLKSRRKSPSSKDKKFLSKLRTEVKTIENSKR